MRRNVDILFIYSIYLYIYPCLTNSVSSLWSCCWTAEESMRRRTIMYFIYISKSYKYLLKISYEKKKKKKCRHNIIYFVIKEKKKILLLSSLQILDSHSFYFISFYLHIFVVVFKGGFFFFSIHNNINFVIDIFKHKTFINWRHILNSSIKK